MKVSKASATSTYLRLKNRATNPITPPDVMRMIATADATLLKTVGSDVRWYRKGTAISKTGLEKIRLSATDSTGGNSRKSNAYRIRHPPKHVAIQISIAWLTER